MASTMSTIGAHPRKRTPSATHHVWHHTPPRALAGHDRKAEYAELFGTLRRFASGRDRTVVYLPGNHDAEAWWNPEIRAKLQQAGLVHEFALSYSAAFESEPEQVVYCEHGNEFDPTNAIHDYEDPLDTPLGHHIVTDVVRRLPRGGDSRTGWGYSATD